MTADAPLAPPPDTAAGPDGAACASCGSPLHGPFCHVCGEKRLDRHDYALGHFVEHAVDVFTHFDLKVLRSLWALVRRPGVMAADVLAGRRVRWSRPFQTFFVANLLFYVGISKTALSFFHAPFVNQIDGPYARLLRPLGEAKAAALGLGPDAYAERYDSLSHTLAKTLVVLLVPVVAGLLAGLFRRHRRYYLEHATVGTLVLSQFMLVSLVIIAFPIGLDAVFHSRLGEMGDSVFVPLVLGANAALFFTTFRRAYPAGTAATAAKAAAFTVLLVAAVVFVYRPLLFLVTNVLT